MSTEFLRNSVLNAAAGACVTLGGFLSSVLVARLLGVGGTGVVAYATWAVTVAVIVADVGIPGTLSRFLPEIRARSGDQAAGGLISLLIRPFMWTTAAVVFMFCIYAWWQWNRHSVGQSLLIQPETFRFSPIFWGLVALSCATQSFASFASGSLQGMQRFRDFAKLAAVGSVVQICGTAIGAVAFGVTGALAGAALGTFVPAWALFRMPMADFSLDRIFRRRVIRYTLETWGTYIVSAFFASRMEVFFIERSWGSHSVGLFTISLTLSNLATQGPMLLTGALLPQLSQYVGRGEHNVARSLYPTGLRLMSLIVFPACFGTAAIAPVFLSALYGPAFADAVPSATILLAGAAIGAATSIAVTYANASELTRFSLSMGFVGAILSVISGLVVIPSYGVFGAALGRAAIQLTLSSAMLYYVYRRLQCRLPAKDIGRIAVAAICCAIAARGAVDFFPNSFGIVLGIVVGAVNYYLVLTLLMPFPQGDLDRLVKTVMVLPPVLRPAARASLLLIARPSL